MNRECFNIRHTFHSSSTVTEKNPCLVDLVLTLMVDTTKDARRSRRSEIQVCKHRAAFDEIQSAYRFLLIANRRHIFFLLTFTRIPFKMELSVLTSVTRIEFARIFTFTFNFWNSTITNRGYNTTFFFLPPTNFFLFSSSSSFQSIQGDVDKLFFFFFLGKINTENLKHNIRIISNYFRIQRYLTFSWKRKIIYNFSTKGIEIKLNLSAEVFQHVREISFPSLRSGERRKVGP